MGEGLRRLRAPSMQLLELCEAHALQLQADGRSPHSVAQVRRHARVFATWLAAERHSGAVADLEPQVVARFLVSDAALRRPDGKPKLAGSVNAMRTSIRCLLKYAHDAGLAQQNAGRLVRRAHCTPPPPRALPQAELARLLAVLAEAKGRAAERDHALFAFLASTGLRIGSALALDIEHIDLDDASIRVDSAKGGTRGRVFLAPGICDHLRRFIGDRTSGPLFVGWRARRLGRRQAQARLSMWCRRAGILRRVSPHGLRHSFATELLTRAPVEVVQAALLHASIGSTMRYARTDEARLRAAIG